MKLKQLEMTLQKAKGYAKPRPSLEQYMTPAPLAARLLYHALMKGDIEGKTVCDLGSGTGVLAIGAALLGAESVKGVEKDPNAVVVAKENAALFGADVEFITADVLDKTLPEKIGPCDTVIMNPPFGAQKIHADRPFIDLALTAAPVVYSIFNAGSTPFVKVYIRKRAEVAEQVGSAFAIKRTFAFHTRDVREFEVEILRLIRKH
ncbi:MAG: METTL5 family protein [Methanoregula sp.]|nr:METTL5 family protein [Methanoregula sp.]